MATNENLEWKNLVIKAINGSQAGLFRKLQPQLHKIAVAIIPNKDIDDAIQAAYIRIWQRLNEVDLGNPATISSFLYRLGTNAMRVERIRIIKEDPTKPEAKQIRKKTRNYYQLNKDKLKAQRNDRYKRNSKVEVARQQRYNQKRREKINRLKNFSNLCRVYVAGPISGEHMKQKVEWAIQTAAKIREYGYTPFVPHLFYYWDEYLPQTYEYWIKLDIEWLAICDVILRLHGESKGAKGEVLFAENIIKLPIVHSISELRDRFPMKDGSGNILNVVKPDAPDTYEFLKKEFNVK